MDKQKFLAIVSSSVICGVLAFSFLNILALGAIDISGIGNNFRFFEMSNGEGLMFCNNLLIPVTFNQFNLIVFYENDVLGTYKINSNSIMPNSFLILKGNYITDSFSESQSTFMLFDHMFSGGSPIRVDPRKMVIGTEFQTTIIGIPYSVTTKYSSLDFWNILNDENNSNC